MNSPFLHIDEQVAQWFAIRTQFRKEKYVVAQLLARNVEAYIPIQKLRRQYSSKTKWVELPLIPNYAFVKITKAEYLKIFQVSGFLAFVHFSGEIVPIPEREMEILQTVVAEEDILRCETEELNAGDWVEIKTGHLVGLRGQLIKENGKRGFVVRLERLGLYLTIAIEQHLLRKIQAA